MDNSLRRQRSATNQPRGLLASLHILGRILDWLAGLIQLTEEEQKEAGIYFGDQHYK